MVFELLKYGHLHPTRGQDLADRLGMPLRALQSQIMDERIDGHPICASDSGLVGYYLPDSPEELLDQGIKPNTIRLSIGTEHIDDIIVDLEKGFSAVR